MGSTTYTISDWLLLRFSIVQPSLHRFALVLLFCQNRPYTCYPHKLRYVGEDAVAAAAVHSAVVRTPKITSGARNCSFLQGGSEAWAEARCTDSSSSSSWSWETQEEDGENPISTSGTPIAERIFLLSCSLNQKPLFLPGPDLFSCATDLSPPTEANPPPPPPRPDAACCKKNRDCPLLSDGASRAVL